MEKTKNRAEGSGPAASCRPVVHNIAPVWDAGSRVLILGTMPSPSSRAAGFFYMHPRNRFWPVLAALFGERFAHSNASPDKSAAAAERREFLLRRHIALWDVLASCELEGAADATIRRPAANDFSALFAGAEITRVFCTGNTAFSLWQRLCAPRWPVPCGRLPSPSPANASWNLERLTQAYTGIVQACAVSGGNA